MAQRPGQTKAIAASPSSDWGLFAIRSMELFVFSFTIFMLL